MKKTHIEIFTSIGSLALLVILLAVSKLTMQSPGYGYLIALVIYVLIMSVAGLKLAEIPEK
ncbi:MAG: hypothetical protein Q7J35_11785 [Candidatus Methanoperedens sp.]|nr:hypothetical protein [Candidatus Methanoperedens sp.]